jgi:hypothetical protein
VRATFTVLSINPGEQGTMFGTPPARLEFAATPPPILKARVSPMNGTTVV